MSKCPACGFDDSLTVTAAWEFKLPIKLLSGNQIKGSGRGRSGWKYREQRKLWARAMTAAGIDCPPAEGSRRLWLTRLWGKGQRAYDEDNLIWGCKPVVDEIVAQGWLLDDTPDKVERIYNQEKSPDGFNYVKVRLEDVT